MEKNTFLFFRNYHHLWHTNNSPIWFIHKKVSQQSHMMTYMLRITSKLYQIRSFHFLYVNKFGGGKYLTFYRGSNSTLLHN